MSSPQRDEVSKYTYQQYLTWPVEERWELIDGQAYNMTPAPSISHQKIVARFYSRLEASLEGKPCTPFIAPTDVVLSQHDVVQPDVFVVCDEKKITRANVQGIPDLIIEVISPSTALKDRKEKKALYQNYGLREYVLIDPDGEYVERFVLEADGTFSKGEVFSPQEVLALQALEGVAVSLWEVFQVQRAE